MSSMIFLACSDVCLVPPSVSELIADSISNFRRWIFWPSSELIYAGYTLPFGDAVYLAMSTLIGVLTRRLTTSISAWMRRQVSYIRTRCMKNFTSSLAEKASFTISRQYFYGRRSVSCQEAEHIAKKISYGQKWEPLFDYSDVARRTDVYNLPAVMYCIRSAPLSVISRINALRLFQLRFPKPRPPLCVDVQGLLWSVFRAPLFTCSIYISQPR